MGNEITAAANNELIRIARGLPDRTGKRPPAQAQIQAAKALQQIGEDAEETEIMARILAKIEGGSRIAKLERLAKLLEEEAGQRDVIIIPQEITPYYLAACERIRKGGGFTFDSQFCNWVREFKTVIIDDMFSDQDE